MQHSLDFAPHFRFEAMRQGVEPFAIKRIDCLGDALMMRAVRSIDECVDRKRGDAAGGPSLLANAGMRGAVHQIELVELQYFFFEAPGRQEQGGDA
ncbi:MAG: hypothetical protein ACTS5Y_07265 [Pollutimonas bauzanensis]